MHVNATSTQQDKPLGRSLCRAAGGGRALADVAGPKAMASERIPSGRRTQGLVRLP